MKSIKTKLEQINKTASIEKKSNFEVMHPSGKITLNATAATAWVKKASTEDIELSMLKARQLIEEDENHPKSRFYADEMHVCAQELRSRSNVQSKFASVNENRRMNKAAQGMPVPDMDEGHKEHTFSTFTATNRDETTGGGNADNTEVTYRVLNDGGEIEITKVVIDGMDINLQTLDPNQKTHWLGRLEQEAADDLHNQGSMSEPNDIGEPSDDRGIETGPDGLPTRGGLGAPNTNNPTVI